MLHSKILLSCAVMLAGLADCYAYAAANPDQEQGNLSGSAAEQQGVTSETPITSDPPLNQPPVLTPTVKNTSTENWGGLALGGQLFLAIQNWSKVGTTGDPKIGIGVGGFLGIGLRIDNMKLMVGPALWTNTWSADYSQKSQSATERVFVTMNDTGVSLTSYFDDMFIELGTGKSTLKSGMTVSGREIPYPYDGNSYSYKSVGIGFRTDSILFGLGFKNYDGFAKSANHMNFMFGIGL